jgi:anti-sigma factor ChrR (cupin superfamily)
LLTAYALGILDVAEDDVVTEHLVHCHRCEQDLIKLTDTLCALADAGPQTFPGG